MARGKESKIIPSWSWEGDRLAVLFMELHPNPFPVLYPGMAKAASVPCPCETECAAVLAGRAARCELQPAALQCRNAELGLLRYSGCDWEGVDCLHLAVPAAVDRVVSQRRVIEQAGVGTVSVTLVFGCCLLHVNALTCSLEKV